MKEITISTTGLLGVVFVVLKLCGVIGWSWWWVTAPFWGPFALAVGIIVVFLVFAIWFEIVNGLIFGEW